MTTGPAPEDARVRRRRREHERQAVIYGILIAVLVVVVIASLAIFSGVYTPPFSRPFATADDRSDVTPPCLPSHHELPLPFDKVHVIIHNASGLA
ncbi:MAG: LytR family transcriptional regulator, partial [Cellulomonadaceae bacterium]|nr:LytR family transcriptional regulator [Cellulomonadaceae bacterium]